MSGWTFYRAETGEILPATFMGSDAMLKLNTPEGLAVVRGLHDHRCNRVDLATGDVVACQPPAPPDNDLQTHHWSAEARQWIATPTLAARKHQALQPVLAAIAAAEARQPRALRELALEGGWIGDGKPASPALERLAAIDTEIDTLRQRLAAIDAAADAAALGRLLEGETPA